MGQQPKMHRGPSGAGYKKNAPPAGATTTANTAAVAPQQTNV